MMNSVIYVQLYTYSNIEQRAVIHSDVYIDIEQYTELYTTIYSYVYSIVYSNVFMHYPAM